MPPPPPEPLRILCPPSQTATSPDGQPVTVWWPPAQVTGGKRPIRIAYLPANGSRFPVGTTPVYVSATSKDGQMSNCFFSITIVQDATSPVVGPTAAASVSPLSIQPGQSVTLNTTGTHAGTGALASWVVLWGDGSPNTTGVGTPPLSIVHTYAVAGSFAPRLSVTDVNGKGTSATAQTVTVAVTIPLAPSNLTGQITSPTQITLNWQDNSSNETGFPIERHVTGIGSFAEIAVGPANTPTYQDNTVNTQNTSYDYRVRARNAAGNSAYTNIVTAGPQLGADYFVAPGGSDSAGHTGSQSDPFATFQHALQVAEAALSGSGKVIWGRGATYVQAIDSPNVRGTDAVNRLRVANFPGETVILAPSSGDNAIRFLSAEAFIEFDGINLRGPSPGATLDFGGVDGSGVHDVRFLNAEVVNDSTPGGSGAVNLGGTACFCANLNVHGLGGPYGFYIKGNFNVVEGCDVHDTNGGGFHVYLNGGNPTGNIVRNCRIHDIYSYLFFGAPRDGFFGILAQGADHQFYNNVIYNIDSTQWCLDNGLPQDTTQTHGIVFFSVTGTEAWNNTITKIVGRFITCDSGGSTGGIVRNNLGWQNTNGATIPGPLGSNTIDHNFLQPSDPLFVDAAAHNYRLQAGSPCINQGVTAPFFTTDADGVLRTVPWDQGAYEFH